MSAIAVENTENTSNMTAEVSTTVVLNAEDRDRVAQAVENSLSENTRRAYASAFTNFKAWLLISGYATDSASMFSPETVAAYLTSLAETAAPSTVTVARSAIIFYAGSAAGPLKAHAGLKMTMRGITRSQRGFIRSQARALSKEEIREIVQAITAETAACKRDRAMILLAVSLGLRASDVVTLRLTDVVKVSEGYEVTIPYSKTSDLPVTLALPRLPEDQASLCGCRALDEWLRYSNLLDSEAPVTRSLFTSIRRGGWSLGSSLSVSSVGAILVARAEGAGIDTTGLSAHSMRASMATHAVEHYDLSAVTRLGRWSSPALVSSTYDRRERWNPSNTAGGWLGAEARSACRGG